MRESRHKPGTSGSPGGHSPFSPTNLGHEEAFPRTRLFRSTEVHTLGVSRSLQLGGDAGKASALAKPQQAALKTEDKYVRTGAGEKNVRAVAWDDYKRKTV